MVPERFPPPPAVGRAARMLGGAGMLPQFGAAVLQVQAPAGESGLLLAFGYGSLILSFLGGIWWGFAMHRWHRQRALVCVAVIPSLIPVALAIASVMIGWRWALVALATVLMLTLLVDRRLVERGDAPAGWMGLRVPLSAGLALVTIVVALIR